MDLREHNSSLNNAMSMLGISKDKHNAAGRGVVAFLMVFTYFIPKKFDETDKSKRIMKTKWSMTNSFDHK